MNKQDVLRTALASEKLILEGHELNNAEKLAFDTLRERLKAEAEIGTLSYQSFLKSARTYIDLLKSVVKKKRKAS